MLFACKTPDAIQTSPIREERFTSLSDRENQKIVKLVAGDQFKNVSNIAVINKKDIAELSQAIPKLISSNRKVFQLIRKRIGSYKYQCASGEMFGQKFIFINAFDFSETFPWKQHCVNAMDGDEAFWRVQ